MFVTKQKADKGLCRNSVYKLPLCAASGKKEYEIIAVIVIDNALLEHGEAQIIWNSKRVTITPKVNFYIQNWEYWIQISSLEYKIYTI